jgi:alkylation response protein AidB-like acyl-CoA dehydrogenase
VNLALSDDQRMIRDAAASFLADASDGAAVRAAIEQGGVDEKLWKGIAELGWCGTAIDERHGGLGLGPVELVLILEQMGRHLTCAPFFSSVALAANLLAQAGSAAAQKKYLPQLASGALRATAVFDAPQLKAAKNRLSGRVAAVLDAETAGLLLFVVKDAAYAVPAGAKGLKVRPLETWDGTRRQAEVELKSVVAEKVGAGKGVAKARAMAQLYLAAEQLGGAQQCLDLVVKYTSERKQFGRAIASFQAVKHRCAQMMVRIESLRSLVYGAAHSGDALECAGAKALASETFLRRPWHPKPSSTAPARRSSCTAASASPGSSSRSCTSSAPKPPRTGCRGLSPFPPGKGDCPLFLTTTRSARKSPHGCAST